MALASFHFSNHGSLWLCTPDNAAGREILRMGVSAEAQWWAGGVVVEPRYVESLMSQLIEEGFTVTAEGQ